MTDHELPTHMGFNLTVHRPEGLTPEAQELLWDRIEAVACDRDDAHEVCPMESMSSCVGSAEMVHHWFMRDWDAIEAVKAIDPEAHATKSRDYGRGFAEAIRLVRETIKESLTRPVAQDGGQADG